MTAFTGYVPPWGQMIFWGSTVIIRLASAIPAVGDTIVTWLWGWGLMADDVRYRVGIGIGSFAPVIFYWRTNVSYMLVNRVGDFGLAFGIFGWFTLFQTVDFLTIFALDSDTVSKA